MKNIYIFIFVCIVGNNDIIIDHDGEFSHYWDGHTKNKIIIAHNWYHCTFLFTEICFLALSRKWFLIEAAVSKKNIWY